MKVVECLRCHVAWQWPLGRTTADSEAQVLHHIEEFATLRTAARAWPDWVGLPIFTLAGQASPDGTSRSSIPK